MLACELTRPLEKTRTVFEAFVLLSIPSVLPRRRPGPVTADFHYGILRVLTVTRFWFVHYFGLCSSASPVYIILPYTSGLPCSSFPEEVLL
jgi:hypothetical protein